MNYAMNTKRKGRFQFHQKINLKNQGDECFGALTNMKNNQLNIFQLMNHQTSDN